MKRSVVIYASLTLVNYFLVQQNKSVQHVHREFLCLLSLRKDVPLRCVQQTCIAPARRHYALLVAHLVLAAQHQHLKAARRDLLHGHSQLTYILLIQLLQH